MQAGRLRYELPPWSDRIDTRRWHRASFLPASPAAGTPGRPRPPVLPLPPAPARPLARAVRLLEEVVNRDDGQVELRRLLVKTALDLYQLKTARDHLRKLLPFEQVQRAARRQPAGQRAARRQPAGPRPAPGPRQGPANE